MAYTPKQYETILEDMIEWVIAHTNKLSDFNDGSISKALLGAVAKSIEEAYYEAFLGWKEALRYALQKSLEFERIEGIKATGNVIFSRSTAAGIDYVIPVGTIVATQDGIRFLTTIEGQISIGNTDSGSVSIEAEVAGAEGNVDANTINQLVSIPTGVETVDNAGATTGGIAEESDDDYNERFRLYIQGLAKSTPAGMRAAALSVAGVFDAKVVESTGVVTFYIDDGSGSASGAMLSDVEDVIEGAGTEEDPGYRPAGIFAEYFSANKVDFDITATIYYDAGEDPDELEAEVINTVSEHINSLKIGEDAVIAKVIDIIMSISGVKDVTISSPLSNVVAVGDDGDAVRYNSGSFTMTQFVDT